MMRKKYYQTPQITMVAIQTVSFIVQSPTLTIHNNDSEYPDGDDDYKDPFDAD